jgi:arylsulfatase A-like enzyme
MNLLHSTSLQPIRGGKTFLFEGGLRTPLLIYWPDHTKPGMQSNVPVTSMDLYPTLLDMAGLPQKGEQHIDGVSLVPLVRGEQTQRDTLYWHFPHYQGEGAYPASAIRKGDYKLIVNYHHHDSLLFDVVNDPDETKNLAAAMPEKTEALRKQLMVYLQETGAHIPQTLTK